MNLMSEAEVDTPRGKMTAAQRLWDGARQELPSAGTVMYLAAGLNRFGFKGQWAIDWDLYTVSGGQQQALIGNWAHAWHPSREAAEFAKANGRQFRERQNILRLRDESAFKILLLPYLKGTERSSLRVTEAEGEIAIEATGEKFRLGDNYYSHKTRDRLVVTNYGGGAVRAEGVEVAGGPAEVMLGESGGKIVVHGPAGTRRVKLPEGWMAGEPARVEEGVVIIDYEGPEVLRVTIKLE
ncbi:MAG: hypothetical protein U0Q16_02210 [Bryobacteraceae bacterium]